MTEGPVALQWLDSLDDDENTLWFAESALQDDGCNFQFRIAQRLRRNRLEFVDDSDAELGMSRDFPGGVYETLEAAKADMEKREQENRKEAASE